MSVPSQVDGWSLVRKLGEGSDGVVALYQKADKQAVFKFPSGTDESYKSIQTEDAVLKKIAQKKKLDRLHLVKPVKSVKTNGQFVVEHFLEGITLTEYLMTREISPSAANLIGAQISAGVRELHNLGYAHNDLYPRNILINPNTLAVYIIDYGRSLPADLPLSEYHETQWDYPRPMNDRVKVTVRDDAYVAATRELLREVAARKIRPPLSATQFEAVFNPGTNYTRVINDFMTKATAHLNPMPSPSPGFSVAPPATIVNPFASPPKPSAPYTLWSASPVAKPSAPYTMWSTSPPKPSVPANPWV